MVPSVPSKKSTLDKTGCQHQDLHPVFSSQIFLCICAAESHQQSCGTLSNSSGDYFFFPTEAIDFYEANITICSLKGRIESLIADAPCPLLRCVTVLGSRTSPVTGSPKPTHHFLQGRASFHQSLSTLHCVLIVKPLSEAHCTRLLDSR